MARRIRYTAQPPQPSTEQFLELRLRRGHARIETVDDLGKKTRTDFTGPAFRTFIRRMAEETPASMEDFFLDAVIVMRGLSAVIEDVPEEEDPPAGP